MGKIPKNYECPVDYWMSNIADYISPSFKSVGFTPNGITTLSLIFGLLAVIFLWKGQIWFFAVSYFLSLFFDCMDGHFARKYNMTSKFGDWYDHIKDIVVGILIIVVVILKYRKRCSKRIWITMGVILVISTLLNGAFVGCQAREFKDGDSLNIAKKLCIGDPKKNMKWLRYFGPGIWTIIFISMIVLMETTLCKDK